MACCICLIVPNSYSKHLVFSLASGVDKHHVLQIITINNPVILRLKYYTSDQNLVATIKHIGQGYTLGNLINFHVMVAMNIPRVCSEVKRVRAAAAKLQRWQSYKHVCRTILFNLGLQKGLYKLLCPCYPVDGARRCK